MKSDAKQILMRSKQAWEIKDLWKHIIEECYEYALAAVNPYEADKNQPRSMKRQYDSTAPNAAIRLANRLLNDLTPLHEDWISLETGPVLDMQLDDTQKEQVNKELNKASRIANLVVNQGEAVAARHAAYIDLVVSGMGVILNLEDPNHLTNPVSSQAVSQAEVAIEKDARGQNSLISRKRKMKVRDLKGLWDDVDIPERVKSQTGKDKDPDIEVVEITYKNTNPKRRGSNEPDWYYQVLYVDGDTPSVMVDRGYNENPWTILQWIVLPGCPYGPGPVMLALGDIRVANKIVEMILQNAALALAGMYLVRDDGVVNPDNIQITQGGMIPVGSTGGSVGASVVPLDTGRNFDVGQVVLEEYQTRIKKWLYDNGLPVQSGNPRSATEIIERVRELTQDLGAGIGRLTGDHVDYVRRIVGITTRAGIIPFDLQIDQFTLKIQINSPLARAQQLQKVETVVRWLQTVIELGGEQTLAIVSKLPQIMVWIGAQMGVPPELVNTALEREQAETSLAQIAAAGAMPDAPPAALPSQA